MITEFRPFQKIARLTREIVVSEKIDGTNAQICITEDGQFLTGSRSKWITIHDDNFGFARWANENKEDLLKLGVGCHFGEWWGSGIQRRYDLKFKKFSLFNVARWGDITLRPACCDVVPTLYEGVFSEEVINNCIESLRINGSSAAPGFYKPEGIVIYHKAANILFKKTLENDEAPKGKSL